MITIFWALYLNYVQLYNRQNIVPRHLGSLCWFDYSVKKLLTDFEPYDDGLYRVSCSWHERRSLPRFITTAHTCGDRVRNDTALQVTNRNQIDCWNYKLLIITTNKIDGPDYKLLCNCNDVSN
jgi:hypothetical protein